MYLSRNVRYLSALTVVFVALWGCDVQRAGEVSYQLHFKAVSVEQGLKRLSLSMANASGAAQAHFTVPLAGEIALSPADGNGEPVHAEVVLNLNLLTLTVTGAPQVSATPGVYDLNADLSATVGSTVYRLMARQPAVTIGGNSAGVEFSLHSAINPTGSSSADGRLVNLVVNFPLNDLSSFTAPSLGVLVDGNPEQRLLVESVEPMVETFLPLATGIHTIQVNVYESDRLIGRSSASEQTLQLYSDGSLVVAGGVVFPPDLLGVTVSLDPAAGTGVSSGETAWAPTSATCSYYTDAYGNRQTYPRPDCPHP